MGERPRISEARVRGAVKGALDALKASGIPVGAVIVSDDGSIRIEAQKHEDEQAVDLIDWRKR